MSKNIILVTGCAGFIGFHLCRNLLKKGYNIVGIDNINEYYEIDLKYERLSELGIKKSNAITFLKLTKSLIYKENFKFIRMNLEDFKELPKLFLTFNFKIVFNLAAQAGVRYSINNPKKYIDSNIVGFYNILECSRKSKVKKFIYASSSSIYGNQKNIPFKETDNVNQPISLYAATKKSNELLAHAYSHLFKIKTIGLRFFTVYGPWGRPDMAPILFTKALFNNQIIKVFNKGNLSRDFTYIDDVINSILLINNTNFNDNYNIINVGFGKPSSLLKFISILEKETNLVAKKKMIEMQPGDVNKTWASTLRIENLGYKPLTDLKSGIKKFVNWFKIYYKVEN